MSSVARKYELKKRAERQEQTRHRIAEAAVQLHGEVGPARTTVSAIAQRAGVERHTYYRHFRDERSLMLACSELHFALNPMPDPDAWRQVADPQDRLRMALGELYDYYTRNEALLANVIRDSDVHAITRETNLMRVAPRMAAMRAALADGLVRGRNRRRVLAALDLALDFHTWRTLVRTNELGQREAVDLMVRTLRCL